MPYLVPWIVVGVAGLLTVVGVYGLTRPMTGRFWKSLLRSLSLVILLLPAPVPGFDGQYAPAFIVLLFEAVFQPEGQPMQALKLLGAGVLVVTVLVCTGYLFTRNRGAEADAEDATAPEEDGTTT